MNVTVICYPQLLFSSIALPLEMLSAGCEIHRSSSRRAAPLSVSYIGLSNRLSGQQGICINNIESPPAKWNTDLILLPAIWRNPLRVLSTQEPLTKALKQAHSQNIPIVCVGSSMALLAESGLLDGHAATTHWAYNDMMRTRYPKVLLTNRHFITHSNNIYCCASINALADLTVHLIHEMLSPESAKVVERNFSHEIRRPYRQQSLIEGHATSIPDELVASACSLAKQSLREAPSISEAAAQLDVSTKTLQRRFKSAMANTYQHWLQGERLEEAKELLSESNIRVHEIAELVGFNSESYFIRCFKQRYNITPRVYRDTTRGKRFES